MSDPAPRAAFVRVGGLVQGVGFRPFVFRVATSYGLKGWVRNADAGVEIHVEGASTAVDAFMRSLIDDAPAAARVRIGLEAVPAEVSGFDGFRIRQSHCDSRPTTGISPDLSICAACLRELLDPLDRRFGYPYVNCANCGPRFSIVLELPYDRSRTTMSRWSMCEACQFQYADPGDRRFHAEPIACPVCGPQYRLVAADVLAAGDLAVVETARQLRDGRIIAVKGIGGYHLACDATNAVAVAELRVRKYRKERAFALMARDVRTAHRLVHLDAAAEELLLSPARPIVLGPPRQSIDGIAPDHPNVGVMLPYAPLHHLLFAAGAPDVLVLTSGNRSNEPMAYDDRDARRRLSGIADAFLVGDRPIARRVDDSIARSGSFGPMVLRRSRGLAPGAVANLPTVEPILAMGADLKNTVTLVVKGEAFVSQHLGDLDSFETAQAFDQTIADLLQTYHLDRAEVTVVHDGHPEYVSTRHALEGPARTRVAVQHHRAHAASVLAERGQFDRRVLAVVFDGTGYGDDGTIWGGEWFVGSVMEGFARVGHLRCFNLPGGDAGARHPVQAAAGVLAELNSGVDMMRPPFLFPRQYAQARQLVERRVRTFTASSAGRLFDAVAALLGFTRPVSFEGQAALWLEHLAVSASSSRSLPFAFTDGELDFRPAIDALIDRRMAGEDPGAIASAFHAGLASGVADAVLALSESHGVETIVLTGGVFQNEQLLRCLNARLVATRLTVWTNNHVPPNDGGISLGQAALASTRPSQRC